jgi:hypothetical protein
MNKTRTGTGKRKQTQSLYEVSDPYRLVPLSTPVHSRRTVPVPIDRYSFKDISPIAYKKIVNYCVDISSVKIQPLKNMTFKNRISCGNCRIAKTFFAKVVTPQLFLAKIVIPLQHFYRQLSYCTISFGGNCHTAQKLLAYISPAQINSFHKNF